MNKRLHAIIGNSLDIWEACWQTPFVQALGNGTLSMPQFCGYILDDSLYLREYARVFAIGMARAETFAQMQAYYSLLSFVNESENSTRLQYLRSWGLTQADVEHLTPRPENRAYTDFMLQCARTGGAAEIMMAVLPCMLSYEWLGKRIVAANPESLDGPFGAFLRDYTDPSYAAACENWNGFTEALLTACSGQALAALEQIFRTSSWHELQFWTMSYRTDDLPPCALQLPC